MRERLRRWKEPLKTLLIVLLAAAAIPLAAATGLFADLKPEETAAPLPTHSRAEDLRPQAAAVPLAAVITAAGGLRCGLMADERAVTELYERIHISLSEALGSAEASELISEKRFRKLLEGQSLYLDYGCAPELSVLAAWLGASPEGCETYPVRRLLLCGAEDGTVQLAFLDETGDCRRCRTLADWSTLAALLAGYLPNGAEFAYENDSLPDSFPYQLLLPELPRLRSLRPVDTGAQTAERMAARFLVQLGIENSYTEPDGSRVYLGESGTLRLEAGGAICYYAEAGDAGPQADTPAECIELARQTLAALREGLSGEERLSFASASQTEEGLLIRFRYLVAGLPVLQEAGAPAQVLLRDGALAELRLLPRRYALFGEAEQLLPAKQAAAAAGSLLSGGEAALVYRDGGEQILQPVWEVLR